MLSFNQVSAHYGKIQALHEVSLHINKGEIVTLIGANGAGKTTLLGSLCGEPRASHGSILFEDQDITQWPTAKIMRGDIAIVPEGRRVFSHDGGRESGDGRFLRHAGSVSAAHRARVRAIPSAQRTPCTALGHYVWG